MSVSSSDTESDCGIDLNVDVSDFDSENMSEESDISSPVLDSKVIKEIHHLMKDIDRLTDGQARINFDDDNFSKLNVEVTANEGYYKDETHIFKITLNGSYPLCGPNVNCMTNIFHPNIDMDSVCVNILDDWCPAVGLAGIVTALVFILYNPNYEDPLSTDFIGVKSKKDFARRLYCLRNGISYTSNVPKSCFAHRLRSLFRTLCCCCCCQH